MNKQGLPDGLCPWCGQVRGPNFYFVDRVPVCKDCALEARILSSAQEEYANEHWPELARRHGPKVLRSPRFWSDFFVLAMIVGAISFLIYWLRA
jgi:hypothetical protein